MSSPACYFIHEYIILPVMYIVPYIIIHGLEIEFKCIYIYMREREIGKLK
jgi:hypothetical protein